MIARRNILVALFCLVAGNATADQPLWEAGAGVAAIDFPAYRGSDQRQSYILPIPYFVYRGEFLKIEREKIRGLLLKREKIELDISVNGMVPVKSSDNHARSGMPDLDPSLEIGPSLNVTLFKSATGDKKLDLRLPLRPVLASDFSSASYIGWVFQPQVNLDVKHISWMPGWNLGLLAGPIFADARYHQYFYGVDPQYVTSTRPAYRAHGGYAGEQFISALSKRFQNYWVGAFVKFDSLRGAVIDDSPLVRSKTNFSAGFAVSRIFGKSQTMVKDDE